MPTSFFRQPLRYVTVLGCFLSTFALGLCGGVDPASAATGPFSGFGGHWSGTGTIRQGSNPVERVRCTANYRVRGSGGRDADLQLRCVSDTYNFDLAGDFETDASNHIVGRWTERSRNIGGTVIGMARSDRIQIHVESSAFAADLVMITRGRRQSVLIDSQGGGQFVRASITLHRN